MKLARIFEEIIGKRRCAKPDDIRKVFGDYHNLLRWLTGFLIGDEELADACIVDACTIAETQTPDFHEWLIHWGARATVGCALQRQHANIAELASKYEKSDPAHRKHLALPPEYFLSLVKNSEGIHARLDVLCRFVLVLRGIANDSYDKVAAQLGISRSAVEAAYCVAFDTLELASDGVLCSADVPARHINKERTLADSIA
jgi:hypothetical protein